jgi:hypothetical protein
MHVRDVKLQLRRAMNCPYAGKARRQSVDIESLVGKIRQQLQFVAVFQVQRRDGKQTPPVRDSTDPGS